MPKTIEQKLNTENTTRPPIVVVMGHVDHGKTTLLDYIRKTRVAEKEAGGITQHIGAYTIEVKGKRVTFIDTPGHEAFKEMRSRGARVADIGILVVAADEGVKPQTKEAISIIKSANIPYLVAFNKIDRPGADIDRVKKELADNDVLVESWGGKTPSVGISAKTGEHVDELIETILLLGELEELKADHGTSAEGVVIESHRDTRRGATATILLHNGVLKRGEFVVIDGAVSTVKIFEDFQGNSIDIALPSDPVRIAGLTEVPLVGAEVRGYETKDEAEHAAGEKKEARPVVEESLEGRKYINVILKTDVSGSREAIEGVLKSMQLEDVGVRMLRSEVGDVSDADLLLALSSSNVVIIGFKVKFPSHLLEKAKESNVTVIQSEIIYELFDQLEEAIRHLIPAEIREVVIGKVRILKFFKQEKSKQIVGGRVVEGVVQVGTTFRVMRKDSVVGKGKISGLQIRQTAVREVAKDNECGLLVEADIQIAENDVLEVYKEERVERSF